MHAISHVCDVQWFYGPENDRKAVPDVFIELPHGATELKHLSDIKSMISDYPAPSYDDFFCVNTDQGSPEYAFHLAKLLTSPDYFGRFNDQFPSALQPQIRQLINGLSVVVLRCFLPRTIVDVNRVWTLEEEERKQAKLTGTVGSFVQKPQDLEILKGLYQAYQAQAREGYAQVCGSGGFAFNLHTYAPISVNMVEGEYIVDTLQRAYHPDHYPQQVRRPLVQLITKPPGEKKRLVPDDLCDDLLTRYGKLGLEPQENDPFPLHPATTSYAHTVAYPHQVLTMEISRKALAHEFKPFEIMEMDMDAVHHYTAPLAASFLLFLARQRRQA